MQISRNFILFVFSMFLLWAKASSAEVNYVAKLAYKANVGGGCSLYVMSYFDPTAAAPGEYKGFLMLAGNGWRTVPFWGDIIENPAIQNHLLNAAVGTQFDAVDAPFLEELTAAGYMVFAPEYRGWENPYDELTDKDCGTVNRQQTLSDVDFALALVSWSTDVDGSYGWTLGGFSAGGNLAAWLSRHSFSRQWVPIRGVMAVDSPINFWDFWSYHNGTRDEPLEGARNYTVPLAVGTQTFSLNGLGLLATPAIQKFFKRDAVNCDLALNQGPDCFTKHHDAPGELGFISANSFVSATADDDDAPIFMTADINDPIVPPESVHSVCESYGALNFVGQTTYGVNGNGAPVNYYVWNCGTTANRYVLIDKVWHIPLDHVATLFIQWDQGL